jgi:tetratricopeptide (TPR) repeat protein
LDARLVVAHKRLARLLIDGGELDGAATRLKAVLDDKVLANDPEAHYLMGVVRDKQQDYQAALERFMSAFRINPKYPRLKRALGVTMFKLKRYRDAVQILSKVYEATREINTYYFIGRSLMELKDYQKAANIFQAIISNRPSHAEARFDLATLLDNGNQGQAAGAHYSAFLQILQKAGRKDMTIQARTAKDRIEALRAGAGGK